ncbi:MAG: rhodanese-like domain-containing protein [Desulfobacteraceae bacterium]|nr:MAG: rhodanese-like domain-containing protein [Desulfobacteraceae bacterium]
MLKLILKNTLWQIPVILLISACVALGFNQIRNDRVPLICQWDQQPQGTRSPEAVPIISIDEAALLFKNNKAIFIDARPESFYNEGHIKGALSLPWQEAEDKCFDVVEKIPEDIRIITYCDGANCELCDKLAVFLCDLGFEHVNALINGWTVWNRHNLPVNTGNSP